MVISLSLLTIILGGSISLVLISSRAMSSEASNPGSDAVNARAAADQIIDDLKVATAISEQSATAITMTVPDRDGDGSPETIRYSWTGLPGAPLLRKYNGRSAAAIANNVIALNFAYLSKTVGKPPPLEGNLEAVFVQHLASQPSKAELTATKGVCGYFKPGFEANVVYWKLTTAEFQLERDATSTGTITASLYYAGGDKRPTGAPLQTATTAIVGLLGESSWTPITFSAPVQLDPSKSLCLTLTASVILAPGAKMRFNPNNDDANAAMSVTLDGGATWGSADPTLAPQSRMWGKITTQDKETLDFQPLPGP